MRARRRDWTRRWQFIKLGGLKHLDVFTLHRYPRAKPPEYIEPCCRACGTMDEHGAAADLVHRVRLLCRRRAVGDADQLSSDPAYVASERIQAEYQVRIAAPLLANGVEKIFFHAGTGSAINHGNLWTMFLRYGSEPSRTTPRRP